MNGPQTFTQDGAVVAREAHNFEVAGSNPAPAPKYEERGAPFDEPMATCSGEWCNAATSEPDEAGC